ncbi:TPA: hypothetical protein QCX69_000813 [Bacillus anthracis]|nr:hypothetical protein [Bacillus anthracis]
METTKEMLIGAIKDMKDAERRAKVLEKMVEIQNEIDVLWGNRENNSQKERHEWLGKHELMVELQDERVTEVKVMEAIIEAYEITKRFEETYKNEIYSSYWEPRYGRFEIETGTGNVLIGQYIYVRDEEVFLNDEEEKYDSIESAFEKIRSNLHEVLRRSEQSEMPSTPIFNSLRFQ